MSLKKYFSDPENSTVRERIFDDKLAYDLKMAAARARYSLAIFRPQVDRDGFDIILSDDDNLHRVQLKTAMDESSTATWEIPKTMLRPTIDVGARLGSNNPYEVPMECGFGGGFILIEVELPEKATEPSVTYDYTDYLILEGMQRGIIKKAKSKALARKKLVALSVNETVTKEVGEAPDKFRRRKRSSVRISLSRTSMLTVKSPDALLAVMGLASTYSDGTWVRQALIDLIGKDYLAGVSSDKHQVRDAGDVTKFFSSMSAIGT